MPITQAVGELAALGHIPKQTADGIASLIKLGNEAAHGASVDPEVSDWAITTGVELVKALKAFGGD